MTTWPESKDLHLQDTVRTYLQCVHRAVEGSDEALQAAHAQSQQV
jgi:hypothetical protein